MATNPVQSGYARGDIVAIAADIVGDPLSPNAHGAYYLDRIVGLDRRSGTRVIESTRTVPAPTIARGPYPATFRDGAPHTWALSMPRVRRALWAQYRADGMPRYSNIGELKAYVETFRA